MAQFIFIIAGKDCPWNMTNAIMDNYRHNRVTKLNQNRGYHRTSGQDSRGMQAWFPHYLILKSRLLISKF
ncbi:unnamed protein product [Allacma fusca]|uniref:Uncharacterized protein n=1 Tax=Allacma fusca TaxID=39272 RepID=A0A8J2KX39_9HEXA|nr:unnamed protein product [Allacma fusca]